MTAPPARPRVLFLGHGAERLGPPVHLALLLEWLNRSRRIDAEVVVARGGVLVEAYRASGAEVTVAARGREPLEPFMAAARRIGAPGVGRAVSARWLRSRLARGNPPDLVYVNTVGPTTLALLDAVERGAAPLLLHVHELELGLSSVPGHDLSRLLGRADGIVAASQAVADHLAHRHGVDPARVTVAHGFVDVAGVRRAMQRADRDPTRRRLGVTASSIVVGSVGLPDWRKAPEHLLTALWHLRRDRPDLDLHVVWVGGEKTSADGARLADEAHRLGLGDRLHHVGHVESTVPLLAAMDLFVLPSREDAFPLAALEAAVAGLPVVAFASGGIVELVDATVGRVVAYPDTVAMAEAIAELADAPELRHRLGGGARARVVDRHDVGVGAPRVWAAAEALLDRCR